MILLGLSIIPFNVPSLVGLWNVFLIMLSVASDTVFATASSMCCISIVATNFCHHLPAPPPPTGKEPGTIGALVTINAVSEYIIVVIIRNTRKNIGEYSLHDVKRQASFKVHWRLVGVWAWD